MEQIAWFAPFQSIAILGAVVAAWICIRNLAPWQRLGGIAFAISMGLGTVVIMSMPVELAPGVRFDFRTSLLAAAALIGGPVAIITGAMAAGYRIYLGGAGTLGGVVAIVAAVLLGLAFRLKSGGRAPSNRAILLLSVATSLSGVLISPLVSADVVAKVMGEHFFPLILLKCVGTAACAILLRQDGINGQIARENLMYRRVFEAMPDGLSVKDAHGRFMIANPAMAARMCVATPDALTGKTDFDFFPASYADMFRKHELDVMADRKPLALEQAVALPDGVERHLDTLKAPLFDPDGEFIGLITHNRDVTETRIAQAELHKQMEEYHALFDNSLAGIYRSTIDGRMLKANAALVRLNGFDSEAELLAGVEDIAAEWYVEPTRREDFKRSMEIEGRVTDFVSEVYRYKTRERIWVSETAWNVIGADGKPAYFEGTVIEITDRMRAEDEMKKANVKLLSLAATDGLTGLMNRRSFDEILESELAATAARGEPLSLILIDVDHFKAYNDRYGHLAGDDCLRFLGHVLRTACRTPSDIACRYGGEEMAIILPGTSGRNALSVARRLSTSVRGLNLKHEASRKGIVTVSIGVSTVSPQARVAAAVLIRNADEALYSAKANGRDRVEVYAPEKKLRAGVAR